MRDVPPVIDYAKPREGWGAYEWTVLLVVFAAPLLALFLLFAWQVWRGIARSSTQAV